MATTDPKIATQGQWEDLASKVKSKADSSAIPTKTSDLVNNGSDNTSTYVEADELGAVATSNSYNDLSNKPTIPAAQIQSDWNQTTTTAKDYIKNKPTKVSDFTNDAGYTTNTGTITKVQANGTDVASSGTANIPAATTAKYGVTELSDSLTSTSTGLAATANAVRSAYQNGAMYVTCSTGAGTAAKVGTCSNFVLLTGSYVSVKFTNANTVASPTLNVNSTGAKAIYVNGSAAASGAWAAGDVKDFVYDGTNWVMVNARPGDNVIASSMLKDSAVTTAKINGSAVTTAKINNGAVTADKIDFTTLATGVLVDAGLSSSSSTTINSSWTTVSTKTISNLKSSQKYIIMAFSAGQSNYQSLDFRIIINGTSTVICGPVTAIGTTFATIHVVNASSIYTANSSSITIDFQFKGNSGTNTTAYINDTWAVFMPIHN